MQQAMPSDFDRFLISSAILRVLSQHRGPENEIGSENGKTIFVRPLGGSRVPSKGKKTFFCLRDETALHSHHAAGHYARRLPCDEAAVTKRR